MITLIDTDLDHTQSSRAPVACCQVTEANETVKAIAQKHLDKLAAVIEALQTLAATGYDADAASVIEWHTTGDGCFEGKTDLPGALDAARNEAAAAR